MDQQVVRSRDNPLVKQLRSLRRSRERRRAPFFLVEGPKFVLEGVAAGIEILALVVSEDFKDALPPVAERTKVLRVSARIFEELSDTPSPRGILAQVRRSWSTVADLAAAGKHVLVAWGVQDPGNVGTMIRCAAAFGLAGVIVSPHAADPFAPKAVRASAAAILHHPPARAAHLGALTATLQDAGCRTCWTGPRAPIPISSLPVGSPLAVFIGPEGKGFSQAERETIGDGICIPMAAEVESLNAAAAAAILAYELARRS
jgi:TrmH family RNA methyltransferase